MAQNRSSACEKDASIKKAFLYHTGHIPTASTYIYTQEKVPFPALDYMYRYTFLILLLTLTLCQPAIARTDEADSLLQVLPQKNKAEQAAIYTRLCRIYWQRNADLSNTYGNLALSTATEIDDQRGIMMAHRVLGGLYFYQGQLDMALWHNNLALSIAIEQYDHDMQGSLLNNLGIIFRDMGDFKRSMDVHQKSMLIARQTNNKGLLVVSANNVGRLFIALQDYNEAASYLYDGMHHLSDLPDPTSLRLALHSNLARMHSQLGNTDSARYYLNKTLLLARENENINRMAEAWQGLGILSLAAAQYDSARLYFYRSLLLDKEFKDTHAESEDYYHLARLALAQQYYDSTYYFLQQSQEAAKESRAAGLMKQNYELLSKYYKETGDAARAIDALEQYIMLEDSLFNEQLAHELTAIRMEEAEAHNLEVIKNKEQELDKERNFSLFLLIITLLAICLIIAIIISYVQKRRDHKRLRRQNEEITRQNEKIASQKAKLERSNRQLTEARKTIISQNEQLVYQNEELEERVNERTQKLKVASNELNRFLYKLSHDIQGPLTRTIGLCQIASMELKEEKATHYFSLVSETVQNLNHVLMRLQMVNEIRNMKPISRKIDFERIIAGQIQLNSLQAGYEEMDFDISIDEQLDFEGNPQLLEMVLFNLIENALRFRDTTPGKKPVTQIRISMVDNNRLCIDVIDNGIGINDAHKQEIFEMFNKTTTAENSSGLGLYLSNMAIEAMGGVITLEKNPEQLTHFRILI